MTPSLPFPPLGPPMSFILSMQKFPSLKKIGLRFIFDSEPGKSILHQTKGYSPSSHHLKITATSSWRRELQSPWRQERARCSVQRQFSLAGFGLVFWNGTLWGSPDCHDPTSASTYQVLGSQVWATSLSACSKTEEDMQPLSVAKPRPTHSPTVPADHWTPGPVPERTWGFISKWSGKWDFHSTGGSNQNKIMSQTKRD